ARSGAGCHGGLAGGARPLRLLAGPAVAHVRAVSRRLRHRVAIARMGGDADDGAGVVTCYLSHRSGPQCTSGIFCRRIMRTPSTARSLAGSGASRLCQVVRNARRRRPYPVGITSEVLGPGTWLTPVATTATAIFGGPETAFAKGYISRS